MIAARALETAGVPDPMCHTGVISLKVDGEARCARGPRAPDASSPMPAPRPVAAPHGAHKSFQDLVRRRGSNHQTDLGQDPRQAFGQWPDQIGG